jgi:hypothetical protein
LLLLVSAAFGQVDTGTIQGTVNDPTGRAVPGAQVAITTSVELEATTPLLQTQDASVGQVFTTPEIDELPLNGRNYIFLAQLTTGTTTPVAGEMVQYGGIYACSHFITSAMHTVIGLAGFYLDFSTHKSFHMQKEGHELQFRWEAFNAPNHPAWGLRTRIFPVLSSVRSPRRMEVCGKCSSRPSTFSDSRG